MRWFLLPSLLIAVGLSAAPAPSQDPGFPIVFSDVTKTSGIHEHLAGIMGHGAAVGDFDGDGKLDIYVGGFCDRPNSEYAPAKGPIPNRLFRNVTPSPLAGEGGARGIKFELIKQPAVEFYGRTSGAVFADLDNRGWLDIYSANNAKAKASAKAEEPQKSALNLHSKLLRNDKGVFVDMSKESGACPDALLTARNIGVFDYDGDGKLDLFVVEDKFRGGKSRSVLLRNKGNFQFEDANQAAGLPDDIFGLGLAVADLNGDGKPDFFVPHSNRLFLSKGDGTYREAVELKDVFGYKPMDGEDWACGAAFGDLCGEGRLDLVVTHHHTPARIRLFKNLGLKDGVPQFKEITSQAGLDALVPVKCPHVEIQDFDNDGKPDIYVSAAWLDADGKVTPLIFRNLGARDGIPQFTPSRPIKGPMVYYPAGPSGDFDGDGRLDLFLVNWFQGNHCRLMKNESDPKNHWLNVRVAGKTMNRMGIGSQVRLYQPGKLGQADALVGFQEVTIGYGYASGQAAVCHFGLGSGTAVDVEVTLPGGKKIARANTKADQTLVVEE